MTALVLLALAAAFVAWKLAVVSVKLLLLVLVVATALVVVPLYQGFRVLLR